MANTQYEANIINGERKRQADSFTEWLANHGAVCSILPPVGDDPHEYQISWAGISAHHFTFDLALKNFVGLLMARLKYWYVITYCERKDAFDQVVPAEWFILNAPYATKDEAETVHKKIMENTKGTDAEWPEAYAAAKIVHRDELAQYGLKPLNEELKYNNPWEETNPWSLTNPNGYWHD